MADGFPELCCDIKAAITPSEDCAQPTGGIYDVRIACKKYVVVTEEDCSVSGAAKVTNLVTRDPVTSTVAEHFYTVAIREDSAEYTWQYAFDIDNTNLDRNETLTMQIDIKDSQFYCTIQDYIGQQVMILFREKGTDRWYIAGRDGGLVVSDISGGTGTTDFTPTTVTVTGTDVTSVFIEVFSTDAATTDTLIDGITAA